MSPGALPASRSAVTMPAPDSLSKPAMPLDVGIGGEQRRRHPRRLLRVALVVLVGDDLVLPAAVGLDVGLEARHRLAHVAGVDDRHHRELAAVRQLLHHLLRLGDADLGPVGADIGEPARIRQVAVIDHRRHALLEALLDRFGQRRIPAAHHRDAVRLLRADLVDRGDEARQVEVGRPGDDDPHAELLGDPLHADIVVLHEERQVRLVRDPVVGLRGVGRSELGFLGQRRNCRQRQRRAGDEAGDQMLHGTLPPFLRCRFLAVAALPAVLLAAASSLSGGCA